MTEVTLTELLSYKRGLPLGLKAPVMMPNGVMFLFSSDGGMFSDCKHCTSHAIKTAKYKTI